MLDFFERYDDLLIPEPNSGCLIWLGALTTAGYGHGHRTGEHFYAHRSAYESVHGIGSLDGLVCRHGCDFPPCCNTDHLLSGDHRDNVMDMIRRGRSNCARGERSSKATVRIIRRMGASGSTVNQITKLFPVKRNAITAVLDGETWTHLGGAVDWKREFVEPPHYHGEDSNGAILTEVSAISILRRLATGERGAALAKEFGVSQSTVSAIKTGRIWSHLKRGQTNV